MEPRVEDDVLERCETVNRLFVEPLYQFQREFDGVFKVFEVQYSNVRVDVASWDSDDYAWAS